MKSILRELFYGNVTPGEYFFRPGSEYRRLTDALDKAKEEIAVKLSQEEKSALDSYEEMSAELMEHANLVFWRHGFKIGLLIGFETLELDADKIMRAPRTGD